MKQHIPVTIPITFIQKTQEIQALPLHNPWILELYDNQLVFSIKDYQGRPYLHFKAYVMWYHDDVRIEHFCGGIVFESPMNGIEWENTK